MNKKSLPSGNIIIVNQHISKQQNLLSANNDKSLSQIGQFLQKAYNANISVYNIPSSASDEEIKKQFDQFGTITQYRIAVVPDTVFKKANFNYLKTEEAQKAIQMMNESQ